MTIFDPQFERNRKELRQRVQAIQDAQAKVKQEKSMKTLASQLSLAFGNLGKVVLRGIEKLNADMISATKYGDSLERETRAMLNAFGIQPEDRKALIEAAKKIDDWNYRFPIRWYRRMKRRLEKMR